MSISRQRNNLFVVIKRYSTVSPLDKYQKAAVAHAFDAIVEQINM